MDLKRVGIQFVFLLTVLVTVAISLHATSFYVQPFPKSVSDAPSIVRGRVGEGFPKWAFSKDGAKRIYTYYEFQVSEIFKGDMDNGNLNVRELGGEIDGVGMEVPGTAKFKRDEDVVLFLGSQNSDESYDIKGLMLGKYNVQVDENGDEYLTGPGIQMKPGINHSGHEHENEHEEEHDDTEELVSKWTLRDLRELIRRQGEHAEKEGPRGFPKRSGEPTRVAPPLQQKSSVGSGASEGKEARVEKEVAKIDDPSEPQEKDEFFNSLLFWLTGGGAVLISILFNRYSRKKRK